MKQAKKQTKLSKQQKKIIMILGESHDKAKKKGFSGGVKRIELKRKATDTPGAIELRLSTYKPMTNSANASVTRSLKSLKKRGLVDAGKAVSFNKHTLTEEGRMIYKGLKKTK